MMDTSRRDVRLGAAGLGAALLLALAACGEPAEEGGDQQQGSVSPPTEQSSTMLTQKDSNEPAERTGTQ